MTALLLALALVTGGNTQLAQGWQSVAVEIIAAAEAAAVPSEIALAVAWHESRLRRDAVGALGEIGPMQIRPHLHCPDGCDPIVVGVETLARYRVGRSWPAALCRYKGAASECAAGPLRLDLALRVYRSAGSLRARVWWLS